MNFAALPDPVATARGSDTRLSTLGMKEVSFKSPIYGALVVPPASLTQCVNVWARENPTKGLGHYPVASWLQCNIR